jgi:two-component system, LytTR family, response regulator
MMIRTILVEDEPLSRLFLQNLLKEFCPQISVISVAATESAAIQAIRDLQPDLVFMDIELQEGTGFGVLKNTTAEKFQVIFTTALDHEAINIIRLSGVEYLQKPIDIEGLQQAIQNIIAKRESDHPSLAVDHLLQTFNNNNQPRYILLYAGGVASYIPLGDIVRIEMKEQGCCFTMKDSRQIIADKTLKEYESLLSNYSFFRTHQHHLVNINEIKDVTGQNELHVLMNNGDRVLLSEKKKAALLNSRSAVQ